MLVLTSAQYISSEFIAELGKLPPAFLPIGTRRLYQEQIAIAPAHEKVVLTLPKGFKPNRFDQEILDSYDIQIIYLDPDLSLKDSLLHCLIQVPCQEVVTRILHGDTLIQDIDWSLKDCISLAHSNDYYKWAGIQETSQGKTITHDLNSRESDLVVSGYFSFSDKQRLLMCLSNESNFINALNCYSQFQP